MSRQGMVRECVFLARSHLIRARILRQEAVVESEFDNYYNDATPGEARSPGLYARAEANRKAARDLLVMAERANGELFLVGGSDEVLPLKSQLCGRDFKSWAVYRDEYLDSDLFRGVDPE